MNVLKGVVDWVFLLNIKKIRQKMFIFFIIKVTDNAILEVFLMCLCCFFYFWITFALKCGIDFMETMLWDFINLLGEKFSVVTLIMQVK